MKHIATKAKLVFFPLAILTLSFIAGYCFLYWLLHIKLDFIPLKEDYLHFWIPMALSLLLVFAIIRRRTHLLKLDKDNGRIRGLYYMVGAAVLCVPTIILLNFLDTATGKLTELDNITDIQHKPVTKFYKPHSYVMHKGFIGVHSVTSYSGKNNQDLNYDIYIALPFTAELYDTARSPAAFLYINYHEEIASNTDEIEREKVWTKFWDESFEHFERQHFYFSYLERLPHSNERDYAKKAARKSELYVPGSPVTVLKHVNKPFNERNGNKLRNALLSLAIGLAVWFVMIAIPGLHVAKVKNLDKKKKNYWLNELKDTYTTIKVITGNQATSLLIGLNILMFIILAFKAGSLSNFSSRDLVSVGALYEPLVNEGKWWRLFTSMFVHTGIIHLANNMIGLLLTGLMIENIVGTKRFLAGYIISGIVGGITYIWWHDEWIVAAGASGAVFGLYGMLLALSLSKIFDPATRKIFLIFLGCTAGYSLLIGSMSVGVANSAHVGGLAAGALIGYYFTRQIIRQQSENNFTTHI